MGRGGAGIGMAAKGEMAFCSVRVESGRGKGVSRLTVVAHAPLFLPSEPPSAPLHRVRPGVAGPKKWAELAEFDVLGGGWVSFSAPAEKRSP